MNNFFNRMRLRSQMRRDLDRLSERQLHDINLERVPVTGRESVYRSRVWNGY